MMTDPGIRRCRADGGRFILSAAHRHTLSIENLPSSPVVPEDRFRHRRPFAVGVLHRMTSYRAWIFSAPAPRFPTSTMLPRDAERGARRIAIASRDCPPSVTAFSPQPTRATCAAPHTEQALRRTSGCKLLGTCAPPRIFPPPPLIGLLHSGPHHSRTVGRLSFVSKHRPGPFLSCFPACFR